jgi:hypothetical protein
MHPGSSARGRKSVSVSRECREPWRGSTAEELAMFRDYERRVARIRVDPGPRLLEELDTTLGGETGAIPT